MKNYCTTLSKELFASQLQHRPYEDVELISSIEKQFIKKRGYVVRLPKANTPVILLTSSGLDSTVVWELLLREHKYVVYPLFLNRIQGRAKKEIERVQYFSRFFQKRYPNRAKPVRVFTAPLPPPEVGMLEATGHPQQYYDPYELLAHVYEITAKHASPKFNEFTWTYPLYGLSYAKYLENTQHLRIRTIFHGVAPGDGTVVSQQSFTSLRVMQLAACATTNDYSWQICALPFEKDIGHWIPKSDLITLGAKYNIPLEKTWSCYKNYLFQCGDACIACASRRHEFHVAAVQDKTTYLSKILLPFSVLRSRIQRFLKT